MSAPATAGRFALVLLQEELPLPLPELAAELARMLGRVRFDVLNALKRTPQIPFDDLFQSQAAEAVRMLGTGGVRAAAVPVEKLPAMPRTAKIHKAVPGPAGLSIATDLVGTMREIPWSEVAALSAATLSESSGSGADSGPSIGAQLTKQVVRGAMSVAVGLPGGVLPGHAKSKPTAQRGPDIYQVLAVSIFSDDLELRLRANQIDYVYLGARLSMDSASNFRLLAADLAAQATGARVSAAFRALVNAGAAPPPAEADAFARHNRWLKLLARESLG